MFYFQIIKFCIELGKVVGVTDLSTEKFRFESNLLIILTEKSIQKSGKFKIFQFSIFFNTILIIFHLKILRVNLHKLNN